MDPGRASNGWGAGFDFGRLVLDVLPFRRVIGPSALWIFE